MLKFKYKFVDRYDVSCSCSPNCEYAGEDDEYNKYAGHGPMFETYLGYFCHDCLQKLEEAHPVFALGMGATGAENEV